MITDKNILDSEAKYLENVMDEIRKQLDDGVNAAENLKKDTIKLQKDMWEEVKCRPSDLFDLDAPVQSWQYQSDIANQAFKYRSSYNMVLRLEKMLKNPYFGRIDFLEDGEDRAEEIYIGLSNLNAGDNSNILVYDWRAPISSMFYDHETGPCSYKSPMGEIDGRMLLKRQYKIENQKIIYMFDSDLRINDEMLQEILGKSTDSRMRTIVTSIQKEQNSVIRNDSTRILIVQGPAGSGKTSVALHRAAYLLYRYRDSIKSENILIFSPNHVFEDYISTVLPQLGEENISRSTFADFFKSMVGSACRFESMNRHMEYILSEHPDPARLKNIRFKSSKEFLTAAKAYVTYLGNGSNIEFKRLFYGDTTIISAQEMKQLFIDDYSYLPYIKRLQKLKHRLLFLIEPYLEALTDSIYKNELIEDVSLVGEDRKVVAELMAYKRFEPVRNEIDRMTSFDISSLYIGLFKHIRFNRGAGITAEGDITSGGLADIESYAVLQLENGKLNYEDMAPVILLLILLGADIDAKAVKHVIIDEAQDYTPVQYEIIRRVFCYCNMTILGDVNQSINAYMNIGSFDAAGDIFGEKNAKIITLTKSYRSTREIADFCNALILSGNNWEQLERSGNKPLVIRSDKDGLYSRIAEDITGLKNKGHKLIAVICKTVGQCEAVFKGISKIADVIQTINISLITDHNEEYQGGTVVVPSYLAKGLEFDAVIVCTADARSYSKEEDRRLLYTVCSRALHELHLYYSDELTYFIKDMD